MIIDNYIKIAIRNFSKRKLYSFINAIGLTIGIAFSLLVYLFILDDHSFDNFHIDKDRIHLVKLSSFARQAYQAGDTSYYENKGYISNALVQTLQEELPGVEYVTVMKESAGILKVEERIEKQTIYYTDDSFFKVFSFEVVHGSLYKLFSKPSEVVLSEKLAFELYGRTNVVGEVLQFNASDPGSGFFSHDTGLGQNVDFTIKAVVSVPENSTIQFEMLLPIQNFQSYSQKSWNVSQYYTFLKLVPEVSVNAIIRNADTLVAKNRKEVIERVRKENGLNKGEPIEKIVLTPLTELHFDKDIISFAQVSDRKYSLILGFIALLIIIIASINYTLFAISSSASRRKEVGIRKTVGASGSQIFFQFNLEAIGLAGLSAGLGIGLAIIFLPLFNIFSQKNISLKSVELLPIVGFLLLLVLIVGGLAGSYPSWFISRFKPVTALRQGSTGMRTSMAQPMVVLQFALSAFLMISAYIMFRQMHFITTRNLGFNSHNIIVIPTNHGWSEESDKSIELFRNESITNPYILGVAGVMFPFSSGGMSMSNEVNGQEVTIAINRIDNHLISMMDIELLEGRNFDPVLASDSSAIIVNESLVRAYGWKDPLNQYFTYNKAQWKVIGVTRDFHYQSLFVEIKPLILFGTSKSELYTISMLLKLKSDDLPASLAIAEKSWKKLFSDKPFQYNFVDEKVEGQYNEYLRWTNIAGITTVLAMLIAGLGMFGLAGINAVNRTKEIGIRKVLGADFKNIFLLLNKPFMIMSLIAFIIATPVSWYLMSGWINKFTYHITISWEIFGVSIVSGLFIAMASVSYHGIKTANLNPAETLKYE